MLAFGFPLCDMGRIRGAAEDMRSAYRQVPILWSHAMFNIIAVMSPAGVLEFFELYGYPLGARHAVHNFNGVAEHLCRIVRRLLHAVVVHCFDDFMFLEPEFAIATTTWALDGSLDCWASGLTVKSPSRLLTRLLHLGCSYRWPRCRAR
jgi:hypothetical protein